MCAAGEMPAFFVESAKNYRFLRANFVSTEAEFFDLPFCATAASATNRSQAGGGSAAGFATKDGYMLSERSI